jgi:hypothetical protein
VKKDAREKGSSGHMTRRIALRLLAAAPAAAAMGTAALAQVEENTGFADLNREGPPPLPDTGASDLAKCLVKNEEDLTRKEKAKMMKDLPGLEGALQQLRDYDLPDDVEPAFIFKAMRSNTSGSGGS